MKTIYTLPLDGKEDNRQNKCNDWNDTTDDWNNTENDVMPADLKTTNQHRPSETWPITSLRPLTECSQKMLSTSKERNDQLNKTNANQKVCEQWRHDDEDYWKSTHLTRDRGNQC